MRKPRGKHADLIETLKNLSASYSTQLDEEKSLKYTRQAYNMKTHLFPTVDHPCTARLLLNIAQSYSNLANEAKKSGDNELNHFYEIQAIVKKREACEMQQRIFLYM
jgi:hypothetical protein